MKRGGIANTAGVVSLLFLVPVIFLLLCPLVAAKPLCSPDTPLTRIYPDRLWLNVYDVWGHGLLGYESDTDADGQRRQSV